MYTDLILASHQYAATEDAAYDFGQAIAPIFWIAVIFFAWRWYSARKG